MVHVTSPFRGALLLTSSLFVAAVAAGASACSSASGGEDPLDPGTGGDASVDGGGFDPDALGDKKVVKIEVTPADKTLVVKNGDLSAASIGYSAKATLSDGSTLDVPGCTWTIDRIDLGSFTASTFKASGTAGGTGKVTCTAAGVSGSTTVTVALKDEVDSGSGLDDAGKSALLAATTADSAVTKLLYPYDGTVFPRGLPSPELQWNGGAAPDVYAITLEVPGMTFTSFLKPGNPARATIPKDSWNKLLDTATPKVPLKVSVRRLAGGAGGTAFLSTTQQWTIAAANLKGSIYYWRINGGKVVRIKPGATAPEDFLKLAGGKTCIACHSVSHDGSGLVGTYEDPFTTGVFDPKTGGQKASFGDTLFSASYPNGSVVVTTHQASAATLFDSAGASLEPSGLGGFGPSVSHPAFSPDGKWLAFASRKDGNWADFNQSDLMLAPFDITTKKFGAAKVLRASGGRTLTYPSFSPDSQHLVYMDSTQSTRPGKGDLHMMKVDGTGDVALTTLNTAGLASADLSLNFEPTFGPVVAGGYFWVVFVSTRQYGNRLNKTYDAFRDVCGKDGWDKTPCRNKQLWVAAIDASPTPGKDPSHAAFWLPGQDLGDQNMRGYWALDPCKGLGEGCEAGFECCEGTCAADAPGSAKKCVKPPPGKCRDLGDKCETSKDCCDEPLGVECIGGVCGTKRPA